jgi:hypothetical protein
MTTKYLDAEETMTLIFNLSCKGYIKKEEVVKVFTTFDIFEKIWEYMYYEEEIENVIEKGNLKILKQREKFKLQELYFIDGIWLSSYNGHLEVIKYLHSLGYKGNEWAINYASKNGHLEVIKYLHSLGYKGNEYAIIWASQNGHLETIKYLHSLGYKGDKRAIDLALENGHSKVVKYLESLEKDI